jgi:propionate catabolism operon transcriptional regulator
MQRHGGGTIKMTPNKKFRFALVSHSEELGVCVRRSVNPETEDVTIKVVNMGEAIPTAEALIADGVEIIFGHGGNSHLMFQRLGQAVVDIPRSYLDLIIAILKAKQFDRRIGLPSYERPTDGIETIERLLDIDVHQIVHNTAVELEQGVIDAFEQGIRVVVGGGISRRTMTSLGGRGIIVEPRQSVIEEALRKARMIAAARRMEMENTGRITTILQMIDDGVIGVDNFGRLNIYNAPAEKILGVELKSAMGQSLSKILKDMNLIDVLSSGQSEIDVVKTVGHRDIVFNALPIKIGDKSQGAVAVFKTVSRIENISRKLKADLYHKGFIAKYTLDDIQGHSPAIGQLKQMAAKYANTDATVMVRGDTGTGKELLAQAIHNLSPRHHHPFVALNCAALPESLLESELFGYEEGAFTGAKRGGKTGLFELAHNGTLFLDEIADIPPSLQVRLLRAIESKEVMRVGGDRYVPVDVRIISSSYKDLKAEVNQGRFRADLYYRLAVLNLHLPPLRERFEDIPSLVEGLLQQYQKSPQAITPDMHAAMRQYSWPGNIRELNSFIESYLILLGAAECDPDLFQMLLDDIRHTPAGTDADAPLKTAAPTEPIAVSPAEPDGTLKDRLAAYEQQVIADTLKTCRYSKKETAQRLGISVNTLWRKLNPSG